MRLPERRYGFDRFESSSEPSVAVCSSTTAVESITIAVNQPNRPLRRAGNEGCCKIDCRNVRGINRGLDACRVNLETGFDRHSGELSGETSKNSQNQELSGVAHVVPSFGTGKFLAYICPRPAANIFYLHRLLLERIWQAH